MAKAIKQLSLILRILSRQPIFIMYCVSAILLVFNIAYIGRIRPFNSDDMFWQLALQTWHPFNGNTMQLATTNTFVVEVPFFAITNSLFEPSRRLLIAEAVMLTLSSFTLFYFSAVYFLKRLHLKIGWVNLLPFVWLASFGYPLVQNYLNTVWRSYDMGFSFATFVLIAAIFNGDFRPIDGTRNRVLSGLACIFTGVLIFSDPYRVFFVLVPIVLFSSLLFFLKKINLRNLLLSYSFVGGSFIFAKLTAYLCEKAGIYIATATPSTFIDFEKIGGNIITSVHDLLIVFGADFSGRQAAGVVTAGLIINAALLGFIVQRIARQRSLISVAKLRAQPLEKLWLLFFSALCCLVFVVYTMSTLVTLSNYRYFIIAVYAAIIVLSYSSLTMKKLGQQILGIVLIIAIVFNLTYTTIGDSVTSRAEVISNRGNSLNFDIISALDKEGLHKGYASFWQGNINTYLTNNRIAVLPTLCPDQTKGITKGFAWLVDGGQYKKPADRTFFLVDPDILLPPNCSENQLIAQLGEPEKSVSVRNKSILIYNYDIADRILK